MPKRPSFEKPPPGLLSSWDIYRAASKAKWIGTVEAADEADAIAKAVKEFKQPPEKLIAVRRGAIA